MKMKTHKVKVLVEYIIDYNSESSLEQALEEVKRAPFYNAFAFTVDGFYTVKRGNHKIVKKKGDK